jgi:hypothetical protein
VDNRIRAMAVELGGEPLLFSEKIPQARQLVDVFRRQNCGNYVRLRRGVNFIQMSLPFAQLHELPDALV